jgi:hypothetical protein
MQDASAAAVRPPQAPKREQGCPCKDGATRPPAAGESIGQPT